jgi:L-seryl-tRNA(Ser) seleniumtransferase
MNAAPDPAEILQTLLQQIPSVNEMLARPALRALEKEVGRQLVVDSVRQVLANVRAMLTYQTSTHPMVTDFLEMARMEGQVDAGVRREIEPSLRSVINATGVVLHTNLGRAPLSRRALDRIMATAGSYSNLEYDLESGGRRRRDAHLTRILCRLTGAGSSVVVNNNAAAIFLTLQTLGRGGEVIISRGEMIEIGDNFRIPEILTASGVTLREVGTTNRTRIEDYADAICESTKMFLRVHPSNFQILGFTHRPNIREMVRLARKAHVLLVEDLGSGCLVDLSTRGIVEPLVSQSIEAGVDLVTFSGDKLLGGPQAGIIAGKVALVESIRKNPLFRSLRVDKLIIAALEGTLRSYLVNAPDEVPALRMIRIAPEELERRASTFALFLRPLLPAGTCIEVVPGDSLVGGGATPDRSLPAWVITVQSDTLSAGEIEHALRTRPSGAVVAARIQDGHLLLDLRTVFPEEECLLAAALHEVLVPPSLDLSSPPPLLGR